MVAYWDLQCTRKLANYSVGLAVEEVLPSVLKQVLSAVLKEVQAVWKEKVLPAVWKEKVLPGV
jgi:hypothetical protein